MIATPVSDAQKRASLKWDKEHMANVTVKLTKAQADEFAKACQELGTTRGQVLRAAVLNAIREAKEKGGGQ